MLKFAYFFDFIFFFKILTGKSEAKLCPDGLVFADENPHKELCDIPSNVDCGDRKELRKYFCIKCV